MSLYRSSLIGFIPSRALVEGKNHRATLPFPDLLSIFALHRSDVSNTQGIYFKIYRKLFPCLLRLAVDVDSAISLVFRRALIVS